MVVFEAEFVPLLAKFRRHGPSELYGLLACGLGGALHFLTVLVGSGRQHHRIVSLHALEAFDHIGRDCGIGVTDMRGCVDVINGCGQVVFHLEFFKYAKYASAIMSFRAAPVARASARQSSYSGANE